MLCPVLVGRAVESGVLADALQRAGGGHGAVVFVAGEAGVGKSRLVREVSELATARGYLSLAGRAAELAVPVPFRPIVEALMRAGRAGVAPEATAFASYRPVLGALVPAWRQPGDQPVDLTPILVGEALIRLCAAASPGGMVLVLEDLHWADPETCAVVEYLADNLPHTRLLCLATIRDTEPSRGLDFVRSLRTRRAAEVLELSRLPDSAVWRMAAACLGDDDLPEGLAGLLSDCNGLPFAVEELLASAVASGDLVPSAGGWRVKDRISVALPPSLSACVVGRVDRLGPAVGTVLASAAVFGDQFDWTLLPDVAGVSEATVLDALRQAREAQFIGPVGPTTPVFRFRHSLTRRAVLSGLLAPEIAMRSALAATAIDRAHPGLPGTWCELAAELRDNAGEPAQAAALMLESGRRALRQGALDTAQAALRKAGRLARSAFTADPALAADIDDALIQALMLAGEYERLAPVADRVMLRLGAIGDNPRRQALVQIMTAVARRAGNPDAAAARLPAAREIASRLRDAELTGRADVVAARCALDVGDFDRAEDLARRCLSAAEKSGLTGWAAEVAIEALEVIGRRERFRDIDAAEAAFARAYRIASDAQAAIQRIDALHELGTIQMLNEGSGQQLAEAGELAHQAGASYAAALIDLKLGLLSALGSEPERSLAATRRCEQVAKRIGARQIEARAATAQAFVSAIKADAAETRRAVARAERILPGSPEILFTTWGLVRVTAALFLGDLAGALEASTKAMSFAADVPPTAPKLAWAFHGVLRAVSNQDGRGALAQARANTPEVRWNRAFRAYAEAVMAGRSGRPGQATALAAEGGSLLKPFAPCWNHLLRWLVAPAAMHDHWGEPVSWLTAAAVELRTDGHDRLATACRGLLRRAGAPVPRAGRGRAAVPSQMTRLGVTSREMDVLLLLARGLSNAEIADTLFISPKTVETHVASLIAKTGQTSRRQLIARSARLAGGNGDPRRNG